MTIEVADIGLDPPVFLAPLAGITDLPFRNLVSKFGAGLVVSEMVASQEMVQARPSARARAELGFNCENTAVQIAGKDARWMAECARLCQGNGAKIIDINMGCPAKKVTSGYSGSALMKDLDHALTLIEAVVSAVDVPVTLKMRLGWDDDSLNAPQLAVRAENAGIQMITVHGRTRCQFYTGHADWRKINDVVDGVSVPVICNGDIVDSDSAKQALKQSKADGVMVGRGAQGKPWQLAVIASELFGGVPPEVPVGDDLTEVICTHYQDMLGFYGTDMGRRVARKHLNWYLQPLAVDPALKRQILTEIDPDLVMGLIGMAVNSPPAQAVA